MHAIGTPKVGKTRRVDLSLHLFAALRAWLAERAVVNLDPVRCRDAWLFASREDPSEAGPVDSVPAPPWRDHRFLGPPAHATRECLRKNTVSFEIPDDILRAAHLSPAELRVEIAVMLFEKEKLTLGRAAELADMGQLEFQRLLASREIPIHYDVEDLDEDLRTLDLLRERS
jgi:predicted HTH domain antitoxin